MNNKRLFLYRVIVILTVSVMGLTGCKNTNTKENSEPEIATVAPTEGNVNNREANESEKDADSTITKVNTVSEYYLAMGVFSENIVLNGANRDEAEVSVVNEKICLPQGMFRGIAVANQARKCKGYRVSRDEANEFIDIMENAQITEKDKAIKGRNIEAHMVYLNSHSEFRIINLTFYKNGFFSVDVQADDEKKFAKDLKIKIQSEKNKKQIYLKSSKLENLIKNG